MWVVSEEAIGGEGARVSECLKSNNTVKKRNMEGKGTSVCTYPSYTPDVGGWEDAIVQRLEVVANDDLGDADDAVQKLGTGTDHKHVVL